MLYSFDTFQLDTISTKLYKNSKLICDDEKIIRVLHILCDKYPEVADKQLIIDKIWPEQVVTEWSLSRLISDTRQLLGDNGKDQSHIKTVRGRGFRLNTHVEVQQATVAGNPPVVASAKQKQSVRAFLLVFALIIFSTSIYYFNSTVHVKSPVRKLPLKLAVLPVLSDSANNINDWVKYGLMSMVSEQLKQYSSFQVIPVEEIIRTFPAEWSKAENKPGNFQIFDKICGQLGCSQLLKIHYKQQNEKEIVNYQIIESHSQSAIYEFSSPDVIDTTDKLLDHLAVELIPQEKEIIPLKSTYSHNHKANRDYAIGVHELYGGEIYAARNYLLLALRRQPDFFWAKAYLAEVHYRAGEYTKASSAIEALETVKLSAEQSYFLQHLRSNILYSEGDIEKSLQISRSLKSNSYARQNPFLMGNELLNIGSSLQALGQYTEAIIPLLESIKTFQNAGYISGKGKALFNLANAYYTLQQTDKAEKYYQQARDIFIRFGLTGYLLMCRHQLVTMKMDRGELENVVSELQSLIESYRKVGDPQGELTARVDMINVTLLEKNYSRAIDEIERLLPELEKSEFSYLKNHAIKLAVKAMVMSNQHDRAEQLISQMEGDWSDNRPSFALIPAHIKYMKGNIQGALALTRELKASLGDNWTSAHEDIVKEMEKSLETGEIYHLEY